MAVTNGFKRPVGLPEDADPGDQNAGQAHSPLPRLRAGALRSPSPGIARQGRRLEIGRVPGPKDHGLSRRRQPQTRRLQARKAQGEQGGRREQEQEMMQRTSREQG